MGCLMAPFSFIKWAFTNGIKGFIVLGIVLVLLLSGFFVIRHEINSTNTKPAASNQVALPSVKLAPYQVDTWSRTYYAAKAVKNKDGTTTMTDYYELLKNKWTLTKGSFTFTKDFGDVKIRRR